MKSGNQTQLSLQPENNLTGAWESQLDDPSFSLLQICDIQHGGSSAVCQDHSEQAESQH